MPDMTAMTAEQLAAEISAKAWLYRSQLADADIVETLAEVADFLDALAARLSGMAAVAEPAQPEDGYYIACFKGGPHGYVLWWGPNDRGYTNDLGAAGVYQNPVRGYHNRNDDNVPVPVAFARKLAARRMVDVGDSGNQCMWSAATLRAALAAATPEVAAA